ncbi:hypothetical protein PLESTF_000150500 [Pleodorina starrii]|nr:hypothetical protein PLESTM_000033100 [Pleodorina starrii]GLC64336.1 hypothetical protein PLESTF_000150500 [Pleodorina starrii]
MACNIAAASNRSTRPFVGRQQLARPRWCFVAASLRHGDNLKSCFAASDNVVASCSRRQALLGFAVVGLSAANLGAVAPAPALAKGSEQKKPTIVNEPAALKAQLESQYQQWSSGQFDAWLASQPETIKWQSSYNGVPMKLKGKAGARQYFAMLNADLDIQSYKPLAIFVDNDGDEATVVVEASGVSRRTQQPFKTVFLHAYTIGPMGQIIKFKETTDTTLMAQLVPPPPPAAEGTAGAGEEVGAAAAPAASQAAAGAAPVEPGSAARSA